MNDSQGPRVELEHYTIYKKDFQFVQIIKGSSTTNPEFFHMLLDYYLRGQRNDNLDKNIASLVTDETFGVSSFSEAADSVFMRYL